MGQVINPTTPYRKATDMPEVKIKKEWYCKLSTEDRTSTTAPVWVGMIIAVLIASVLFCIDPKDLLHWGWVRYLGLCVAYMLIWSAIFMRRREVKE